MRLFVHQLRGEQLLYWRSREAAFFTFLLPILFFVLLGSVYGGDRIEHVKGSRYLLAGMLGYGVVATAFAGLAISLVIDREAGVLKRLRATPLPPRTYIAALLASTLLVYALEATALIGLGRLLFGVALPHRVLSLALALLLGALAFAAMGLGLSALVRSAEGSSAVVNAVYLPMAFISGSFFSPHSFPRFLRAIADVLPLTYFIRLLRDVTLRGHEIWDRPGAVAVVAAWGLAGVAGALRGFRWEPREG
jgi:ABC-2 type transport system permease protein